MRLLLDTHIFLWFISGDAHLPGNWREDICDAGNEVYLSVISLWEALVKHRRGKLPLPHPPESYLPTQRARHQIASRSLDEASIRQLAMLSSVHRDPFDRRMGRATHVTCALHLLDDLGGEAKARIARRSLLTARQRRPRHLAMVWLWTARAGMGRTIIARAEVCITAPWATRMEVEGPDSREEFLLAVIASRDDVASWVQGRRLDNPSHVVQIERNTGRLQGSGGACRWRLVHTENVGTGVRDIEPAQSGAFEPLFRAALGAVPEAGAARRVLAAFRTVRSIDREDAPPNAGLGACHLIQQRPGSPL